MVELRTDYITDIATAPQRAKRNMLMDERLRQQNVLGQQSITKGQRDIQRFQFQDMQEATDYFMQVKDNITIENWPRFRQYSEARGVPRELMPTQQFFIDEAKRKGTTPQKELDYYKMTAAQKIQAERKPKPTSLIEQYNFAKQQFKDGTSEDPGSFTKWKKSVAKAGATKISFGEKVALHEAKAETTAKIALRKEIQSPKFRSTILSDLKKQYGRDWKYLESFEKEEFLFREMDKRIKEAYPQQEIVFDESKGGWINKSTKKLIRRYEQATRKKKRELLQKGGFSPRRQEPSINILSE